MTTSLSERLVGALGAALVLLMLGYLLVIGLAVRMSRPRAELPAVLDVGVSPAPKPPVRPPRPLRKRSPAPRNAGASPAKREPSPASPPKLEVLATQSAMILREQAVPGASPAPGTGGGSGSGDGEGSGTGGSGTGDGGGDVPPQQIRGHLNFSDLPEAMRARGASGKVSVRYEVDIRGRVGDCTVTASSGDTELDQRTCQLIRQRFRFEPSRDARGSPVPSTIEEEHSWKIEQDGETAVTTAGSAGN